MIEANLSYLSSLNSMASRVIEANRRALATLIDPVNLPSNR